MLKVTRMCVVVPARNEEKLLPATLTALRGAIDACELYRVQVRAVVVVDRCRDATASLAHAVALVDPRFCVFETEVGMVGAARRLGVRHCLTQALREDERLEAVWLANTDADTIVPEHWLTEQLRLAHAGYHAVLGTVLPDGLAPARVVALWQDLHWLREDHECVFGANLGLRASSYRAVGGFDPVPAHEDQRLVSALRQQRCSIKATHTNCVLSSARTQARAPHGFGAYLHELARSHPAYL